MPLAVLHAWHPLVTASFLVCSPSPEPAAVVAAVTPQTMDQPPPSPLPADPASPSKRLRHKKINFLEMLKGEDSSQASSPLVEGGVSDSGSPSLEEVVGKGSSGWKVATVAGHNRRNSKEVGSPAKRGRKDRQKGEEVKRVSLDQTPPEPEITVDSDSPDAVAAVSVKNKKRSPGSSSAASLSTSSRSPKSRFGPIRVNVKSLVSAGHSSSSSATFPTTQTRKKNLFGRKASIITTNSTEEVPLARPLRTLRISHQDAVVAAASGSQQILSPIAEVHLDLYKRASSPCVKCSTCNKFLSVPGFLKHQHCSAVGDGSSSSSQGLVAVQQQRRLVPVNKENVSAEEQLLWNEFLALQARLDHCDGSPSLGAGSPVALLSRPGTSLDVDCRGGQSTPADDRLLTSGLHHHPQGAGPVYNGLDTSSSISDSEMMAEVGATSMTSPDDGSCSNSDALSVGDSARASEDCWEPQISVCSPPTLPLTPSTRTEKFIRSVGLDKRAMPLLPSKASPPKKQPLQRSRRVASPDNVRTSSRKRMKKQFYSFENYEFCGGGSKKRMRMEADAQDTMVDVTGTVLQDDVTGVALSNGSSLELG